MSVEHPVFLVLLPLDAIAFALYVVRMKRALSWGGNSDYLAYEVTHKEYSGVTQRLIISAALRAVSFALIFAALAGIRIDSNESWKHSGQPPAHRSGAAPISSIPSEAAMDAVALVFDISYSMNAMDGVGEGGYSLSRMDAASLFCGMLLPSMRGKMISVVLAKGDGVVAVPLTEDTEAVEQCLNSLSSTLMSAAGTNLGAGIRTAESTFPDGVSFARHIWLFTDGDETAGSLSMEVERAADEGISVVLVGVGSVKGAEVTAGDGKTMVHTALKDDALKSMAHTSPSRLSKVSGGMTTARARAIDSVGNALYIAAAQNGAASVLLSTLTGHTDAAQSSGGKMAAASGKSVLAMVAAVLFVLSIVAASLPPRHSAARQRPTIRARVMGILLLSFILVGCSSKSAAKQTISGVWAWHQGKMQRAAACFLRALQYSRSANDDEDAQYALYNVAASYIAMNEYDAALLHMDEVSEDSPSAVRYAAAYNRGVIAMGRGEYDKAVAAFRQALMADPASIAAKENLEIANDALRQVIDGEKGSPDKSKSVQSASQAAANHAMLDKIREQDKKQWQAREQSLPPSTSADY